MPSVVDTVVLLYFLLVDELDLLLGLLDEPVGLPRIVFDPDDPPGAPDEALSELRRSVRFEERAAAVGEASTAEARRRRQNVENLETIADAVAERRIEVWDMIAEERELFASLTSSRWAQQHGLRLALDPGEAACIAIAVVRGYDLASDDNDALVVLAQLASGHPYERIRKLLIRAANAGVVTRSRAEEIHAEMRSHGFWNRVAPFGPETA